MVNIFAIIFVDITVIVWFGEHPWWLIGAIVSSHKCQVSILPYTTLHFSTLHYACIGVVVVLLSYLEDSD